MWMCYKEEEKQIKVKLELFELLFYLHFILLHKKPNSFWVITGQQSQNTSKDSERPQTLKYRVVSPVFEQPTVEYDPV